MKNLNSKNTKKDYIKKTAVTKRSFEKTSNKPKFNLDLKFDVPKVAKLIEGVSDKDSNSNIRKLPVILLGLTSLALKNRDIIFDIIKIYKTQLKTSDTQSRKIIQTIIIYFENLYKLKDTDFSNFLYKSLTLIKLITDDIPDIFTKSKALIKINVLSIAQALSEKTAQLKKIFITDPIDEQNKMKQNNQILLRIAKLEQSRTMLKSR